MNKIITFSTIAIISIALLVVMGGAISEYLIKPNQTVLTVNEEEISTKEFQSRVRFIRQQYVGLYGQMFEYLQYLTSLPADGTEEVLSRYYQELISLQNKLDNHEYIGYNAITSLGDEIVLRYEAEILGISISEEELEIGIQAFFNYYPDTGEEIISEETSDAEPDVTPEPTVDLYQQYLDNYNFSITQYEDELNMSEADFITYVESQMIAEKIYQFITEDVERISTHISLSYILVDNLELADDILANYNEFGDWESIQTFYVENSELVVNFGDIDNINTYNNPEMFADLEGVQPEDVIGPIETQEGYSIFYVTAVDDDKELSEEDLKTKKIAYFQEWLADTRLKYEILYKDDWLSRVPTDPEIPFQIKLQ